MSWGVDPLFNDGTFGNQNNLLLGYFNQVLDAARYVTYYGTLLFFLRTVRVIGVRLTTYNFVQQL